MRAAVLGTAGVRRTQTLTLLLPGGLTRLPPSWLLPSQHPTHIMFIKQTAESKLRMLTSVWNVCDLLSFAPPLLETLLRATGTSIRWVVGASDDEGFAGRQG